MAGSKSSLTGEDFYGAYDAQDMASKHAEELNMQTIPSLNITYTEVGHHFLFYDLVWLCQNICDAGSFLKIFVMLIRSSPTNAVVEFSTAS